MPVKPEYMELLTERFLYKGLRKQSSVDVFNDWTVPELKLFLKLTDEHKGTAAMRKDQLYSKVVELWKSDNEINNEIDSAFGVCFDVVASAAQNIRKTAMPGEKYPPIFPGMKKSDFNKWTVPQLQDFLQDRAINKSGQKEQLVNNVNCAYNMGLDVVFQDPQQEQEEVKNDKLNKLLLENGLVMLPIKAIDGWVKAPLNIPSTTYDDVISYMVNNNAGKAYKRGKSLLESGHLDNIMTHVISPNLRYCFVQGTCLPEQRLGNCLGMHTQRYIKNYMCRLFMCCRVSVISLH